MSGPTDIRAGRHATNEAAYRRINERIRRYEQRDDHGHSDPMRLCAEGGCIDQVHINVDDCRRVRQDARRFEIAPDHDAPEIEDVVERHAPYWVVENHVAPEPRWGLRSPMQARPCGHRAKVRRRTSALNPGRPSGGPPAW